MPDDSLLQIGSLTSPVPSAQAFIFNISASYFSSDLFLLEQAQKKLEVFTEVMFWFPETQHPCILVSRCSDF